MSMSLQLVMSHTNVYRLIILTQVMSLINIRIMLDRVMSHTDVFILAHVLIYINILYVILIRITLS